MARASVGICHVWGSSPRSAIATSNFGGRDLQPALAQIKEISKLCHNTSESSLLSMALNRGRMLRWVFGNPPASRMLSEEQFIWEVLDLAEHGFAELSDAPMLVEGLDGPGSAVQWRAYLQNTADLLKLARQLSVERCLRAEKAECERGAVAAEELDA